VAQSLGAENASGSATLSASPSAATTAGDLLVAAIRDRNVTVLAPVTAVTDTNTGDHWLKAASITQGTNADGEIWYVANAASLATSQSVTVTVGGTQASKSAIAFTVVDVTGAATSSPLDVIATKSGNTQPASSGPTAATAQASEIAIGDIGWNNLSVAPSGQTAGYTATAVEQSTVSGSAAAEQAAWQLLTATGAQSYSAALNSSTVAWTGAITTFKVGTTPAPTITSFRPISGVVGTSVTITGTGFTAASAVVFGATAATYTVTDDSHVSATVPSGAITGPITVTAPPGTVTSSTSFTVNPSPPPTITSFRPISGVVGTTVAITGSGYTGASAVVFNGTAASYTVTRTRVIRQRSAHARPIRTTVRWHPPTPLIPHGSVSATHRYPTILPSIAGRCRVARQTLACPGTP